MRSYPISLVKGVAAFLALAMVFGSVHHMLYDALPDDGIAGSISTAFLLFLTFVPAIASGYLTGRLTKAHGIASGAFVIALGIVFLGAVFPGALFDMSQSVVFLVIGALAGGCGELHANGKAA